MLTYEQIEKEITELGIQPKLLPNAELKALPELLHVYFRRVFSFEEGISYAMV